MSDYPIKHLSFSSMNLYANCPQSWYGRYIEQLREPTSPEAQFGIDFESALAQQIGFDVQETEENPETGELEIIEKTFNSDMEKNVGIYLNHEKAWKSATDYQKKIEITPEHFKWLADKFGVKGSIPLPFIGYIDFMRKDTAIMDLKTSKRSGWKPQWGYQMIPYMLAEELPMAEIHQFVRTKTPKTLFYALIMNEGLAQTVLNWMSNQAKGIKSLLDGESNPHTNNGWMCGYCAVKNCKARDFNDVPALG